MDIPFDVWLLRVMTHGESVQAGPPGDGDRVAAEGHLRAAHARRALDLAGVVPPFTAGVALAAAAWLAAACWRLAGPGEGGGPLPELPAPVTAADHLAADLTLRFLPGVRVRARTSGRVALVADIDAVLRRWPLSGVLADLDGGPETTLDFGGHAGLQLDYAERLARNPRPGWVPAGGPAREWAERVFHERGRPLPDPPPTTETASE